MALKQKSNRIQKNQIIARDYKSTTRIQQGTKQFSAAAAFITEMFGTCPARQATPCGDQPTAQPRFRLNRNQQAVRSSQL